ncbi:MAG: oligosaccharide flippase family protein [Clostridia bacterium]|nr:oligosaccharide flippase family protein [Clostridia bacterium]
MAKRREGFLQGILYLMVSQVLIKILGMVYSLYLTNKRGFGDEGNAICMAGFQVYALLLGICAIGVPNAVSKMVSENMEIGDMDSCRRVLRLSLAVFTAIGFLFCLILYFGADFIATHILSISASKRYFENLSTFNCFFNRRIRLSRLF